MTEPAAALLKAHDDLVEAMVAALKATPEKFRYNHPDFRSHGPMVHLVVEVFVTGAGLTQPRADTYAPVWTAALRAVQQVEAEEGGKQ